MAGQVEQHAEGTAPARQAVIVTYNSRAHIGACLSSLDGERVVLVDNASSDGTVDAVSRFLSGVRVIANRANVGFAAAANQGFQEAGGDDVVLVNPDVVVEAGALDRLAATARGTGAGLVAPRLVNPDGTRQESARAFPSLPRLLARRTPVGRTRLGRRWLNEYLRPSSRTGIHETDWVIGAVMYLPRAALDAVGGFDERFFLYGEDVDLCVRLWRAGLPVLCDTDATAVHGYARASKRTLDLRRAETRHHWASVLRLASKYPGHLVFGKPVRADARAG